MDKIQDLIRVMLEDGKTGRFEDLATKMVGDGGSPNIYFVTRGFSGLFHKDDWIPIPGRVGKSETFFMTEDLREAYEAAKDVELDIEGWTEVLIEDRKNGVVYQRVLTFKPYEKEFIDDDEIYNIM
jgi:hypothetical protein